jgi:hypothetical protein
MWVLVSWSTSCHEDFAGPMDTAQRAVEFLDHVAERRI